MCKIYFKLRKYKFKLNKYSDFIVSTMYCKIIMEKQINKNNEITNLII